MHLYRNESATAHTSPTMGSLEDASSLAVRRTIIRSGPAIVSTLLMTMLAHGTLPAEEVHTVGSNTTQTASTAAATKDVRFKNGTISMAARLYFPPAFNEAWVYSAIVAVHPGGGVKEQTAGLYASKLAERGFVALTFDASHQGDSGGEPRFLENPTERVEDIRSAVDYLTTVTYVDANRIGALGICAGGGYALNASQTDHRIKAVATVSAVDIGATSRTGWDGTATVVNQLKTLAAVAQQRVAEAKGAEAAYSSYVPESPDASTPRDLREATDYYRTQRGQHPNSTNRMLFTSFDKIFAFEALGQVDLLTQPVLFIAGSEAGSRWQSEGFHAKVKGTKELFIIPGATHMTLYDRLEHVQPAVVKLTSFYTGNL